LLSVLTELLPDDVTTQRIREAAWRDARGYTMDRVTGLFLADFASLISPQRDSLPVSA
jgi:hypothetical protein